MDLTTLTNFLPAGTVLRASTLPLEGPFGIIVDPDDLTQEELTTVFESSEELYVVETSWGERMLQTTDSIHKAIADGALYVVFPLLNPAMYQ